MPAKVFIGSTSEDLKSYRRAAIEICLELGFLPVAMENFEARSLDAVRGCLDKVRESHLYVGIFAHRYGYIPENETRSITEIEYDEAATLNLDRLCFLVDENMKWSPKWVDMGESGDKLKIFKSSKIDQGVMRNSFKSLKDFQEKLRRSLLKWAGEHSWFFPATQPSFPFINRKSEIENLGTWLTEAQPLISINGRDGFGKTYLVKHGLSKIQMETPSLKFDSEYIDASQNKVTIDDIKNICLRHITPYDQIKVSEAWEASGSSKTKIHILVEMLNKSHFVLVLDNLDSLQDSKTGQIPDDILSFIDEVITLSLSRITIITTSRNTLSLTKHTSRRKQPLPLSGFSNEDGAKLLNNIDHEHFNNLEEAKKISANVYGIPRALELIAEALPLSGLSIDEYFSRFKFGRESDITKLVVGKAIDTLPDEEKLVLEILAVLEIPVNLTIIRFLAAEALTEDRLVQLVQSLHSKALIKGKEVYEMEVFDRSYCYNLLSQPKTTQSLNSDFTAQYFHHKAAEYYSQQLQPKPSNPNWDSDNLSEDNLEKYKYQYAHLIKANDYEAAWDLLIMFDEAMISKGNYSVVINLYKELENRLLDPSRNRMFLQSYANVLHYDGKISASQKYTNKALEVARKNSDIDGQFIAYHNLATVPLEQGNPQQAVEALEEALPFLAKADENSYKATLMDLRAIAYCDLGQPEVAINYIESALSTSDSEEDNSRLMGNWSYALILQGKYSEAAQKAIQGRKLAPRDKPDARCYSLYYLALSRLLEDDLTSSEATLKEYEESHDPGKIYKSTVLMGLVMYLKGNVLTASNYFSKVIDMLPIEENDFFYARALAHCGLALIEGGPHASEAARLYQRASVGKNHPGTRKINGQLFDLMNGTLREAQHVISNNLKK